MKFAENSEVPRTPNHHSETTSVFGRTYNVEMLFDHANTIPVREMSLSELQEAVSEGNYYWTDKQNKKLGPFDLLKDWESAEQNPDYADHVNNIKNADLQWPIWITRDGHVFNGMHRLTRYFLEGVTPVQVKVFDSLPDEALIT